MKNIEGTPGLEWTVYNEENRGWKSEAGGRGSGDGLKEETLEGKEGGGWSRESQKEEGRVGQSQGG